MPECQKFKNGGLDQYDNRRFARVILPQSEKCGTERVNSIRWQIVFVDAVLKHLMSKRC